MIPIYNSLYGNYRTRKFAEIYPNVDKFTEDYNREWYPKQLKDSSISTIYYLLYARYGNNPIANSDENQFRFKVFATIFMYGPSWEKRLEIQSNLRALDEKELLTGAKTINNLSYNPSTPPSTDTLEELPTINQQTTNQYKKSKLDAYNLLWNLIKTDVTESFLYEFRKLFLQVVAPQVPLWYITDINQEEEIENDNDDNI